MPGRRRIETSAPIRSSLANAAFAVEERVVWGGAESLRRIADVVRWPFERLVWVVERGLVWPLEERTGKWSPSLRVAGVIALALLAAAAGVLGLVLASGDGSGSARVSQAVAPASAPTAARDAKVAPTAAAPVLQGAKPNFQPEADGGAAGSAEAASPTEVTASPNSTAEVASSGGGSESSSGGAVKSPGPTALKVARQFTAAFVLYEVGSDPARVREVFGETATPEVSRALLQREPRQPAGAKVPQAKVLNIVPGPHHGDTYTLSASLLRVGVSSELRLTMQRDEKTGEWKVTDVLG